MAELKKYGLSCNKAPSCFPFVNKQARPSIRAVFLIASQTYLCCNLRFLYKIINQCPDEQDEATPEICFATMFIAGGQERCAWAMDIFDLNGGEKQAVQVAVGTMVCRKFGDYVCGIIGGLSDVYSAVIDSAHRSMEYLSNAQDRQAIQVTCPPGGSRSRRCVSAA